MPDAHVGYGLPIGGVLATSETVIPYAVGVDIACRMRISIYESSPHILGQHKAKFEKSLVEQCKFGMKERFSPHDRPDHAVLEDEDWNATKFLKPLRQKAIEQLGTSGGGNHFVEWGEFELESDCADLNLAKGKYLALLSHSGSRAVGFKIANEFSRLAMSLHPQLDAVVKHLAWLDLDSDAGRDYWLSMELAGRFAAANHEIIHARVAKAAGVKAIAHVENHHNFAWKESMADGSEAIVHRKGATPAGQGVLGIIPGSMADPGFVVRGLGNVDSLHSASHGAGRKLGRKAAINSLTKGERDRYLEDNGVKLLGGGLDEAPQAYKNIHEVIAAQSDLVEILGKFTPRIVRMADEAGDY
jgi:tRNA-splicing ligase RtcB